MLFCQYAKPRAFHAWALSVVSTERDDDVVNADLLSVLERL